MDDVSFIDPLLFGRHCGPALQSTMANHVPRNEQGITGYLNQPDEPDYHYRAPDHE
jgi:hypothetical protein